MSLFGFDTHISVYFASDLLQNWSSVLPAENPNVNTFNGSSGEKPNERKPINVKSTYKTPLFPSASKSREKKGGSDMVWVKKERA